MTLYNIVDNGIDFQAWWYAIYIAIYVLYYLLRHCSAPSINGILQNYIFSYLFDIYEVDESEISIFLQNNIQLGCNGIMDEFIN